MIVSEREWTAARKRLLEKEKALSRLRDEVNAARQALPRVRVEKAYRFEGPDGTQTLAELFDGRSQLVVYHFMFGPGWEAGCPGCSFLCDHIDGANLHLAHHDVTLLAVSRAPWTEIQPYKERMGWNFRWVSSFGSDFNYDFGASYTREELDWGEVTHNYRAQKLSGEEQPGISVFVREDDGTISHTYSCYERGGDLLIGTYNWLDLTPKGRNEEGATMDWMRRHDEYEASERPPRGASGRFAP